MNVSVLILTKNEQANIVRCLESVSWSDDVLVVDSFSTDRTVELVRAQGAKVLQNRFLDFAHQRNWGLQNGGLKHDWVLHLDADEVVSPALKDELLKAAKENRKSAFRLASKTIFQGRWLKYSGLYPSYQVRFGLRDKLRFHMVGHGQRETLPPGEVGTLQEPLLHYSFEKGLSDWIERHNRYSTAEAQLLLQNDGGMVFRWSDAFSVSNPTARRRALKHLFAQLPFRPTLRFLYMFCFRLGFLDGRAGFTYCRLLSIYEYFTVLKIKEMKGKKSIDHGP